MRVSRRAAIMAALLTGLGMTMAVGQPAFAKPYCDGPNPPPICDGGNPSPSAHSPVLYIDGAQQNTSRTTVHVWGWTADADAPTTPLTVNLMIDNPNVSVGSVTADQYRPDVAAYYPRFGAAHGFDVVLPTSAAAHVLCVRAISVGGGANETGCRATDDVVGFEAYAINYDTAHAVVTGTWLEQLDKVVHRNATEIQQSTEISGEKTATDTEGWEDTKELTVTVSTTVKAGIPVFVNGTVTVTAEGSYSYTQNGSRERSQTFSWTQPVLVPEMSIVEATVTITHVTISVPYTLTGDFIYRSGARAAGSIGGKFTGGNGQNLTVNLMQYNLDGTPATAPVEQPPAAMLKATVEQ